MIYIFILQVICFSLIIPIVRHIDTDITYVYTNSQSFKKFLINYTIYNIEDLVIYCTFIFIISPVALFSIGILLLINRKKLVYSWKIKAKHDLGFSNRTILGYKGKVVICNSSGQLGEDPKEVIKRIKKKYGNSVFAEQYINAVKEVTQ